MRRLKSAGLKMIIYQPFLDKKEFFDSEFINNIDDFKARTFRSKRKSLHP